MSKFIEDFEKLPKEEQEDTLEGIKGKKVQIMYSSPESEIIGPHYLTGIIESIESNGKIKFQPDDNSPNENSLEINGILELKEL